MRKPHPADVWSKQSENDLLYAKAAFRDGFWAHVCFLCQQASEKALKSLILRRAKAFPMTQSLVELWALLRINGNLRIAATVLDQYYVTARYPLGMTALAPYELLTSTQAKQAHAFATTSMLFRRFRLWTWWCLLQESFAPCEPRQMYSGDT